MAFLTTRVNNPDKEIWVKLKRVLKYPKGTIHMKLKLKAGSMSMVILWVDTSYNTHRYFRGNTGSMVSLGKVSVVSISRKNQ